MLENLIHGLTILGTGPALGYLFGGALAGMLLGVIPGLGGPVVLSIILVFIYHIDVTGTLCLFLGTQAGSYFSASITSILINTPAHPEAFAVTLDGFPMARKGEPGRALGISAMSTCVGGVIGCACLVGFIQIINQMEKIFHPPEYVALVLLAMLLVSSLGSDAVSKAIISTGLGLMSAVVGPSPVSGDFRYTFGHPELYGGISLVAMALGAFAIPQMVMVFGTASIVARQDMMGREIDVSETVQIERGFGRQVMGGIREALRHRWLLMSSSLIGVITGVIPGIGGFAANFLSYGIAQQTSRRRDLFGTGVAEGIIAPEASSLSKEAGGLVPIIALGIPGGVGGAFFLAALTIKGIRVGYGFSKVYPTLAYEMVWVVALAGLIGTTAGALLAPQLAKVTRVPGPLLLPFIFALAVFGPFVSDGTFFSVGEMAFFAVISLALRRLRYSLAAFVVGLVLGPTLESNMYQTHVLYPGSSFLVERPLADGIVLLALGVLILKGVQLRRLVRRADTEIRSIVANATGPHVAGPAAAASAYSLLGVITTSVLIVVPAVWISYGFDHYGFTDGTLPVVAGFLVLLPALYRLPIDVGHYRSYRRENLASRGGLDGGVHEAQAHMTDEACGEVVVPAPSGGIGPGRGVRPASAIGVDADNYSYATTPSSKRYAPVVEKSWGPQGQYRREVGAYAWFLALVASCYVFGFVWAAPVFTALYCVTSTRRFIPSLRNRLFFAGCATAAVWAAIYEIINLVHLTFTPVVNL